tara:strand:+ start:2028 stop:2255 length:228 start_codon:yes stop_codon:yes gene_type:complete
MSFLNLTIIWGTTIHNDNTISKTLVTTYSSIEELKKSWNKRIIGCGVKYTADVQSLSISAKQYVSADEYFKEGCE